MVANVTPWLLRAVVLLRAGVEPGAVRAGYLAHQRFEVYRAKRRADGQRTQLGAALRRVVSATVPPAVLALQYALARCAKIGSSMSYQRKLSVGQPTKAIAVQCDNGHGVVSW